MLFIDTRISPPDKRWVESVTVAGNTVVHIPALECVPTGISVNLDGFDAAFVASPRAAKLLSDELAHFKGLVWAVGKATALTLRETGIPVSRVGDASGAGTFFAQLVKELDGKLPVHRLAWIAAEETTENREEMSQVYGMEIVHFPVYRTVPTHPDFQTVSTLPKPRTWLFYSGKAVQSFKAYIDGADGVELHGRSAAIAGANLLNAVIKPIAPE